MGYIFLRLLFVTTFVAIAHSQSCGNSKNIQFDFGNGIFSKLTYNNPSADIDVKVVQGNTPSAVLYATSSDLLNQIDVTITSSNGNLNAQITDKRTILGSYSTTSADISSSSNQTPTLFVLLCSLFLYAAFGTKNEHKLVLFSFVLCVSLPYVYSQVQCTKPITLVITLPEQPDVIPGCPSPDCGGHGTCNQDTGVCLCEGQWAGANCNSPIGDVQKKTFTYNIAEGSAFKIWTTPCTHRISPTESMSNNNVQLSGIDISAAKNEYEPFQIIIPATSAASSVSVALSAFSGLGTNPEIRIASVGFTGDIADTLSRSSSSSLSKSQNTAFWITIYVPSDATAGVHMSTLTVTPNRGSPMSIPVRLYVYNFAISSTPHFDSQVNIDISSLVGSGSLDDGKRLLFERRLSPTSVAWPSGLKPAISWDNSDTRNAANKCTKFNDEPYEQNQYSAGWLTRRYAKGEGWLGEGFGQDMVFQFIDAEDRAPRPATFCGISRGSPYGNTDYNNAWDKYIGALENYLVANQLINKSYWYVQNEPQNDDDYKLAAYLCTATKAVAPQLKIAVSEEPKPEIAERTDYGPCGYDIWIAQTRQYQKDYAWQRQRDHGEKVWWYSLPQDNAPTFSPCANDDGLVDGMNIRVIPWASWTNRVTGWAYYNFGIFFENGNVPKIGAELFREAFEDYEYLYLANGGAHPRPFVNEIADPAAKSIGISPSAWIKSADDLMALRYELGLFVEGTRTSVPQLGNSTNNNDNKKSYYINFQDPAGQPTDSPLVVNGEEYMKVGWTSYDNNLGYGWSGQYIGDSDIMLYGYSSDTSYSKIQRSYMYNDYGRTDTFDLAIASGKYNVTIGIGVPGRNKNDQSKVALEGTVLLEKAVNDVVAINTIATISDGSLTLVVGKTDQYTMLAYMTVVAM